MRLTHNCRWVELLRTHGTAADRAALTAQVTRNVDEPASFGERVLSARELLNSHRTLFCRRCAMYDCFRHSQPDADADQIHYPYRDWPARFNPAAVVRAEPCGAACFVHLAAVKEATVMVGGGRRMSLSLVCRSCSRRRAVRRAVR